VTDPQGAGTHPGGGALVCPASDCTTAALAVVSPRAIDPQMVR
jgi:phytoene dehydrogenase-like protein